MTYHVRRTRRGGRTLRIISTLTPRPDHKARRPSRQPRSRLPRCRPPTSRGESSGTRDPTGGRSWSSAASSAAALSVGVDRRTAGTRHRRRRWNPDLAISLVVRELLSFSPSPDPPSRLPAVLLDLLLDPALDPFAPCLFASSHVWRSRWPSPVLRVCPHWPRPRRRVVPVRRAPRAGPSPSACRPSTMLNTASSSPTVNPARATRYVRLVVSFSRLRRVADSSLVTS